MVRAVAELGGTLNGLMTVGELEKKWSHEIDQLKLV